MSTRQEQLVIDAARQVVEAMGRPTGASVPLYSWGEYLHVLALALRALDLVEREICPVPGCVSDQLDHERAQQSYRIERLRGALMEYADPARWHGAGVNGTDPAPWEIAAAALSEYDGKPWVPSKRQTPESGSVERGRLRDVDIHEGCHCPDHRY